MDTKEFLTELLGKDKEVEMHGKCHDCGEEVKFMAFKSKDNGIITDMPFWYIGSNEREKCFCKCLICFAKEPNLTRYQETEVYSRVVGYLRPVRQYNVGKKEEFKMRKNFKFDEREK